jgi:hypothetical protein
MRENLERLSNVVADLVEDEEINAAVGLLKDKLNQDEIMQAVADKQKVGENQSCSSGKEEASLPNEGPAFEQACIDASENEEVFLPNLEAEEDFLAELQKRSKLGLLELLTILTWHFALFLGKLLMEKRTCISLTPLQLR